jgi:hypothetical protein
MNFVDDGVLHAQTTSCRQCRENRMASSNWPVVCRQDLTGNNPDNEILNSLRTTHTPCCEADCQIFRDLVKARKMGMEKRGALIDPCENCSRFFNRNHPDGPCPGMYESGQDREPKPDMII